MYAVPTLAVDFWFPTRGSKLKLFFVLDSIRAVLKAAHCDWKFRKGKEERMSEDGPLTIIF
jgi:hypothetical protein